MRIWTFLVSGSAKCVTQRGVGLLGSDVIGVMLLVIRFQTTFLWVLWDGHPHSRVVLVHLLAALFPVMFHLGVLVLSVVLPREPADRVKILQRLRTQEATHRGQIDKLELDLQRHKDMLQGVLSRIRVESEECDELRAQVAKEQAPADSDETVPPTQNDSQPDEMYLSTVEEESGDESMLMGGSTGAEDEMDVSRDNGIWERRRNAIIKRNTMVKLKDEDKLRNELS